MARFSGETSELKLTHFSSSGSGGALPTALTSALSDRTVFAIPLRTQGNSFSPTAKGAMISAFRGVTLPCRTASLRMGRS